MESHVKDKTVDIQETVQKHRETIHDLMSAHAQAVTLKLAVVVKVKKILKTLRSRQTYQEWTSTRAVPNKNAKCAK